MKRFIFILAVMAACLGLTTLSYSVTPEKHGQFLYIQIAESASLKPAQGSSNSFTLTLKDVHSTMICFSEHPKRKAGATNVKKFIEAWLHPENPNADNFKNDAPNAAINATKIASKEQINVPVTLKDPRYNDKTKTLSYTVTSMEGGDKISAMKLEHVTILIDYCTSCPFRR